MAAGVVVVLVVVAGCVWGGRRGVKAAAAAHQHESSSKPSSSPKGGGARMVSYVMPACLSVYCGLWVGGCVWVWVVWAVSASCCCHVFRLKTLKLA